jgi:hypothetical protein
MKQNKLYVLLIAALITAPAHADENSQFSYFGVGIAGSNFSVNKSANSPLTTATSINSNSTNLNIFAGWQLDSFLGMELDYLNGGAVTATSQGQTTKVFDTEMTTIAATMGTPLNDSIRVYAKLGGTFWKFHSQQNVDLNNGFGSSLGLGADINFYGGSERKLRIEYNNYRLDNVYVKNANSLSINAVFSFPDTPNKPAAMTTTNSEEYKL